jgi:hypothetical protein
VCITAPSITCGQPDYPRLPPPSPLSLSPHRRAAPSQTYTSATPTTSTRHGTVSAVPACLPRTLRMNRTGNFADRWSRSWRRWECAWRHVQSSWRPSKSVSMISVDAETTFKCRSRAGGVHDPRPPALLEAKAEGALRPAAVPAWPRPARRRLSGVIIARGSDSGSLPVPVRCSESEH